MVSIAVRNALATSPPKGRRLRSFRFLTVDRDFFLGALDFFFDLPVDGLRLLRAITIPQDFIARPRSIEGWEAARKAHLVSRVRRLFPAPAKGLRLFRLRLGLAFIATADTILDRHRRFVVKHHIVTKCAVAQWARDTPGSPICRHRIGRIPSTKCARHHDHAEEKTCCENNHKKRRCDRRLPKTDARLVRSSQSAPHIDGPQFSAAIC